MLVPKGVGGFGSPLLLRHDAVFTERYTVVRIGLRRCTVDDCIRTGNKDGGHKQEAGMKNLGLSFYAK